ncbi:MAG: biopolymer transporter ExbD [Planctomycetales bacterium]|nr:biopolymer transporter ExbD [Planctomycetales bacterium]
MSSAAPEQIVDVEEIVVEEEFFKPRPRDEDDDLDITPMIDITFLLLIFFLVTSRMNEAAPVDLPQARHGSVVVGKQSAVIVMKRGTGDQADVTKADGMPFSPDLEQQNAEIAEYIQQELDAGKKHVIIRAEGSVRQGEIGRVSEAIAESLAEGMMINIAVEEQT